MEPSGFQRLLLISFFILHIFNSAHALCVPRNSTQPKPPPPESPQKMQSLSTPGSPQMTPTAAPEHAPVPPVSDPPSHTVPIENPPSKSFFPFKFNSPKHPLLPSTDSNPAIKKICDSTDYPAICLSTLTPHVMVLSKGDALSVLEIAMKASTESTKMAMSMAEKLSTMPGTDPDTVSILKDCKDSYDDALYNFQHAMEALPARDIGTMNSMLSAVITDVGDCDDAFSGMSSPLSSYANKVTKMTSNCLAITSLVH